MVDSGWWMVVRELGSNTGALRQPNTSYINYAYGRLTPNWTGLPPSRLRSVQAVNYQLSTINYFTSPSNRLIHSRCVPSVPVQKSNLLSSETANSFNLSSS